MLCWISESASFIGFPLAVALDKAFVNPLITWLVSAPDISTFPRKFAASLAENPSCCKAAEFVTMDVAKVSILIPVL